MTPTPSVVVGQMRKEQLPDVHFFGSRVGKSPLPRNQLVGDQTPVRGLSVEGVTRTRARG